jgi:hypothetical protein
LKIVFKERQSYVFLIEIFQKVKKQPGSEASAPYRTVTVFFVEKWCSGSIEMNPVVTCKMLQKFAGNG